MDLCAVHAKNLFHTNSFCLRPISFNLGRRGVPFGVVDGRVFEITVLRPKLYRRGLRPFVVSATGKKNNDNSSSSSGNDDTRGNSSADGNKSDSNSEKCHHANRDWREFRAKLYRDELKEISDTDTHNQSGTLPDSNPLGTLWAHPIPVPETGCVLVATEKLDGVRTFERTVILLLRSGTRHHQGGPFGIIINRPLHKKIKHMKPTNHDLLTTFSDCSLHFGGPLEASMVLLKTDEKMKLPGFEEVIPGLCFGSRNSLDDAAGLVKKGILKPQDFRFFVGYAGWQLDQLRDEIDSDYWYVAACSSSLLCGALSDSSESLWEEILLLMGGHYSELSRKPKQDM
ncbi:UPF0301 protein Cpha266_0885 [Vigna umbellata]|uniref:Uncharacterized protein n=1 Tax=Phaseolus angularis TaxID=3914 RepID=A0A8T0JIW4_PHAAN|nr:uncharacterized protein LOC108334294 isoform X1 [Vigna angularis]XP_047153964.1 UPF0301 protein Cpha266_0885 [Vigna umbellata]KAG2372191.1 uncharacterized protein HKW66_Vig0209410 [Vigna angularis]